MLHGKKKKSFVTGFSLPCLQITLTPPRRLIPLGERRKRGQLHLRLPNKCITVWVLCPGLSGPLTWNVPMRQSGATGAWRLAAGRDNLFWGTERRPAKWLSTPSRHFSKAPDMPIYRERAMWHVGVHGGCFLNSTSPGVTSVDSSSRRLVWLSLSQRDSLKGWSAVRFCLAWGGENFISIKKRSWAMFQLHRKCINAHNWITYQFWGHRDWSDTICQWYLVSQIGSEWEMLNACTGPTVAVALIFY